MDAYDLPTLFAHRDVLDGLDPEGVPVLAPVQPMPACRSVALLPGSFNPPTSAHLLLAERALREGFDCVAFVLARRSVGKEPSGLISEDRLLSLRLASPARGIGVVASSCGLYVDLADAAARAFGGADVTFLVGGDKVEQILEPRWYEDRDMALRRLFDRASILVSPRADDGERVREILAAPENAPYARHVSVLPLHPAVSDLSSTRVRGLLQSGADPSGLVPGPVAEFLAEVRAFAPPVPVGGIDVDAYQVRARLVEALWRAREWSEQGADLECLLRLALAPDDEGRALREGLLRGSLDTATLERAQASAGI